MPCWPSLIRHEDIMLDRSAHSRIWRTSDAIFFAALTAGLVLYSLIPIPLLPEMPPLMRGGGLSLVLIGLVMVVSGKQAFEKTASPPHRDSPPRTLSTQASIVFPGIRCMWAC